MRSLIPRRHSQDLEWRPFRALEEIEDVFPDFFRRPFLESFQAVPAVESFVRNGDLVVRADLPGIDPKEVDISVLGNVLTIKGERKAKAETKDEDYIRHEVSYGRFERQLTLPQGVDADKIRATYENGVLEISMPAPKELTPRKVSLKVESKH